MDRGSRCLHRAATLAPRAFEWRYLDAVVLQRLAQHGDAATRLREALAAVGRLFTGASQARRGAARIRGAGREPRALSPRWSASRRHSGGRGRARANRRGQGSSTARPSPTSSAPCRSSPNSGAAHYALALSFERSDNREEAQKALGAASPYGARWPALRRSCRSPRSPTCERTRGAILQRGIKLADAGDIDGAIAAHEAALARDPGMAQAHANLIGSTAARATGPRPRSTIAPPSAPASASPTCTTTTAVLLGLQEKWDLARTPTVRRWPSTRSHPQAQNNLGQALEQQRKFAEAADGYRKAVESQPGFRLARFNHARMLIALDQARRSHRGAREDRRASGCGSAALSVRAWASLTCARAAKHEGVKWSMQAKDLALQFGQRIFAAAMNRELAALK